MVAKQLIIAIPGRMESILKTEAKLAGYENQNAAFIVEMLEMQKMRRKYIEQGLAPHIQFRSVGPNTMTLVDTKLKKPVMIEMIEGDLVVMDEKSFKDVTIYKMFCIGHPMFTEMFPIM